MRLVQFIAENGKRRVSRHSHWAIAAVLIAMFIGLMISLARDTSRLYLRSFQIRSEQTELNSKLQQALNQAEMASHTKTRFLASASHDLRQPIHTTDAEKVCDVIEDFIEKLGYGHLLIH